MIHIAIAEDNNFALQSVLEKLAKYEDLAVKLICYNGQDLLSKIKLHPIHIVLMDIEMPVLNGIETTRKLAQLNPKIKVLALTTFDDDDKIFEMIMAGASGYLLKEEGHENIYKAIKDTIEGGAAMSASIALKVMNIMRKQPHDNKIVKVFDITPREKEILEQLKTGLTYEQIAANLFISYGTVRKHIENIYKKLQVDNKVSAINIAVENKLV
jgi:DNA-binding NarL/FixJ family response regulator